MKIKALVVDNNPVILRAVSSILDQEGCEVKSVAGGLDALECLDTFLPDIVFTDLVMPLVSGEQLCRIIRNTPKYQSIFIVVLSGIVLEDKERILREVDCDVCIAKGNLVDLRKHLKDVLHSYHSRDEMAKSLKGKNTHIPSGLKPSRVAHELLLEKQHHKATISALGEGILELNSQGKVVAANRAILKMLNCREEQIVGKLLPDIIDWGAFHETIGRWTKEQLIDRGMEATEIYEESSPVFSDKILSASLIPVDEGEMVFGLCIFRDITRQFNAEKHYREINDAIRLAKKMDALSCMAGGVAHDFNNLLTVICGNLDILFIENSSSGNSNQNLLIQQAKNAALVAVDLTRQISCFSNFGIVKREVRKANTLIKQAVESFFNNDSTTKYFYKEEQRSTLVSVDSEEITLAIHNILKNSSEVVDSKTIRINVESLNLEDSIILAGQYISAGEYVRVEIEDDGPGIDEDLAYKIFDPYYSTKERGASKGVGLGLTVVYATMRNHGGNVIVSSINGRGTTVTLYLPAYVDNDISKILSVEKISSKRKIFLIDSDKQMLEIGAIMLSHLGFNVTALSNSAEAIQDLEREEGDELSPAPLIILDLSDIRDKSVETICKELTSYNPAIKIIAMCGRVLDPIMEDYQKYGFAHALSKPYTVDSLRHIIHTVLSNEVTL